MMQVAKRSMPGIFDEAVNMPTGRSTNLFTMGFRPVVAEQTSWTPQADGD